MSDPKIGDIWYRIEDQLVAAGVDEFDNSLGPPRLEIFIHRFKVAKITPKGVWLDRSIMGRRFVLFLSRKRYACPTLKEALESFRARKNKQIRIYTTRLYNAKQAILLAEHKVRYELKEDTTLCIR